MNILTIQADALDMIRKICRSNKHKDPVSDILCEVNRVDRLIKELPQPTSLNGVQLIAAERTRQVADEGWSPEHDDKHSKYELILAAGSYIDVVALPDEWAAEHGTQPAPSSDWPWSKEWWKPSDDPIRNLVKAGALIAAEIDRLQRAQAKEVQP